MVNSAPHFGHFIVPSRLAGLIARADSRLAKGDWRRDALLHCIARAIRSFADGEALRLILRICVLVDASGGPTLAPTDTSSDVPMVGRRDAPIVSRERLRFASSIAKHGANVMIVPEVPFL